MAALSDAQRDYFGVFALNGKLLNAMKTNPKEFIKKAKTRGAQFIYTIESQHVIICIYVYMIYLGSIKFQHFRYGRVMFMADQDYDGSHIKGLLINFFYMLSPSLLRIPYFLSELITPIIRAFHCNGIQKLSFYSYPEYEKWWKNWGNSDWRIKYYKGLGSFTHEEGKEFFQNVEIQRKYFVWRNDEDLDAINIAFSKSKTRERRGLMLKFKSSDYRDYTDLSICYKDFLQKEFILYSMASVRRCIPSLIDGQKPSQRKILYGAFKRELFTEIRVDKLIGYVAEHSAYHHDESSLATTLMRMARDYVGSMNINLLMANGQFGTHIQGGKDHASPRYIYTELNPISRFLFPEIDNKLLKYLNEDGISVEPEWYLPIIPLVLVNGVSGIATGWNCSIPCYNPKDIIANIKRFLNDDKLQPMVPWYKGFKGTIDKSIGGFLAEWR
ncbi:DNA topoisomerase 2-like [Lotus japonicus]|uniref:DNA topoisomerase 2-like n=1 Tax=Lotus japonicus TaxID=34305 RepID=UPI00258C393C|nr:DNA topoisomerase 2-like [Lotus japonicus]